MKGAIVDEWWVDLFSHMLVVSLQTLHTIEEHNDGSVEALSLLMEAADNYQFIQQAYHDRVHGVGRGQRDA